MRAGNRDGLVRVMVIWLLVISMIGSGCSGSSQVFLEGVQIASIPIGGLQPEEARELLVSELQSALRQPVVFQLEGRTWRSCLGDLGVGLDLDSALNEAAAIGQGGIKERIAARRQLKEEGRNIPIPYLCDQEEVAAAIMRLTADFDTSSTSQSSIQVNPDGSLSVIEGKSGERVDSREAAQQLHWRLKGGLKSQDGGEIAISLAKEKAEPAINQRTLREMGVNALLGSSTTYFNPQNVNRTYNIKVAADALNQFILRPGELFSFNQVVGPRSEEAGYKEALVILKNEFVPGVGGGVCQVSSTLYSALLQANLPVVERFNHSLPVDYVPMGRDATVLYNLKDLKFINNTPANLIIQTRMGKDRITIQIFGRRSSSTRVTILSEIIERYEPKRIEKHNPELAYGQQLVEQKGRAGAKIKVYRLLEEGGVKRKELVSIDTYKPIDELVQVGTKPQDTPPAGGTGQNPPAGGTGQNPPAGGTGQNPPAGGTGQNPPTSGTGQNPPAGGSGETPPTSGTGQNPPTSGSGETPPASESGETPPAGGSGETPESQDANQDPSVPKPEGTGR